MVCVVGRIRDLILQLSKSSIYSTKPETPCAAEAFQETLNYQSEPLTLGKANKIASECRKRNEMAEVKRVRENERNKIREKQIQALNDAHSVKER
ncbi:hypothetical protein [Shigella boydii]|uniref:hypothetical protein n=1 Tax=Shigella boydii TaxID=621 RepID=UPI0020963435|nr:hypothetical protein [Shigella boydii]